jgi:putative oxidoreductase
VGAFFVGHGTQKLFGWFDGHGPEGTGGFFDSLGIKPGKQSAIAAGVAETAGGALLALGALTPVASTLLSSTMITAARTAHKGKGPWVTAGGWEYNVVLVAAATALAETGPGSLSVDEARFPRLKGPKWAALSLAAAAAGSYLATSGKLPLPGVAETPADEAAPVGAHDEDGRFARPDHEASGSSEETVAASS